MPGERRGAVTRQPTRINWIQETKIGAARHFGARHYRLIIGLAVARRAAPGLLALGALVAVAYAALGASGFVLHVGIVAAAVAVVFVAGVFTWRRWSWLVLSYIPLPNAAAAILAVLVLLGLGGAVFAFWVA